MIKAFNIPIITAIPIDTLNKIVALPFPITQYMINNYNKSSTISLDKYNRRTQLKPLDLKSPVGDSGNVIKAFNGILLMLSNRKVYHKEL
jgi:hypothetical protein